MLRIGLIGGMSCGSTAEYYRLANQLVAQRLGGLHSARLLLASVDFAEIEELQRAGDWERAGALLAAEARSLQAGGVDLVLLCTNTMHLVADAVAAAVDVPLVHIGDVTADAVRAAGIGRIRFLGTAFSMEQPFLLDRLRGHGPRPIRGGAAGAPPPTP